MAGRAAVLLAALPLAASLRIDNQGPSGGGVTLKDFVPNAGVYNRTALREHCYSLRQEIMDSLGPFVMDRGENYLRLLQTGAATEKQDATMFSDNFRVGDREVVISRRYENVSWTQELTDAGVPFTIRPAEGGDETVAYLKHLIDAYDSNASLHVFLHANQPEMPESPLGLVNYIKEIDAAKVNKYGGYASLTHHYRSRANSSQHKLLEFRMDCGWRDDWWVQMFKSHWNLPEWGSFAGHDGRYCCSSFVVTKEAVRAYPKVFYISLLDRMARDQPWEVDSWKSFGRSMAVLWHFIFTGRPDEPRYKYEHIANCPPEGCSATHPINKGLRHHPEPRNH
uniref:Uncharacterized protein n=1 Tax=Alexandrium catenella TaxID=2925 RepID=A0A7S1Q9Q0_ALECA